MCSIEVKDLYQFCGGLVDRYCSINPVYLNKDKMVLDLVSAIYKLVEAHNSGKFSDFENMAEGYCKEAYHRCTFDEMFWDLGVYQEILKGLKDDVEFERRRNDDFDHEIYSFLEEHGMKVE